MDTTLLVSHEDKSTLKSLAKLNAQSIAVTWLVFHDEISALKENSVLLQ